MAGLVFLGIKTGEWHFITGIGVGTLWVMGIMSAIGRRDQSLKVLATKMETLVELQTELVRGRIQMERANK